MTDGIKAVTWRHVEGMENPNKVKKHWRLLSKGAA